MTLNDWLDSISFVQYRPPDRKLHLLTAAFLRRVWDDLPSDHTRRAVEATEAFADGRITAGELARLRTADLLDSCEGLWLSPESSNPEAMLIGVGWDCPCCERLAGEYECRAWRTGGLPGVREAVEEPSTQTVRAALHAREIVAWKADADSGDEAQFAEARAQYEVFTEIVGPCWADPRWPRWRTADVLALAHTVYREQNFGLLPILADALQDAGCDDEDVLRHCREATGHARGCWVVDLAMGVR